MSHSTLYFSIIALSILMVIYWYLVFELIDHLLEKPKLRKSDRIFVGMINTFVIVGLSTLSRSTIVPCIAAIVLLLIEFRTFYRDTLVRSVFCASACAIQILAIRTISAGSFSVFTQKSLWEITSDPFLYLQSGILCVIFLMIAVILVIQLLPLDKVRIINQHKEQQLFMIAWMMINTTYLLFNDTIAAQPAFHMGISKNQIVLPFVILTGLYIILFFAFKTVTLLGYKERNAELEEVVSKEQQYRSFMTQDALITYEFNLTKNLMVKGFENLEEEPGEIRYTDMITRMSPKLIYSEDLEEFTRYADISHIISEFESGKSETAVEYRRLQPGGEYIWCKAITNLAKDSLTGEIRGITCVKNIDDEKRLQMDLHYNAERDSLTGLYNKGVTGKLIAEHLLYNSGYTTSALFMIDVDNFKEINDHLGHVYGDAVLCELGEKLSHIFRSDDIVGRIGGDEFIAYMKSGATGKTVREKAQAICKAFYSSYKGSSGTEYVLSSSVGVAMAPRHGDNFEQLYDHADAALYMAKNAGKNAFRIYDGSSFSGYQSKRTEIEAIGSVTQKTFRENRIEYVFKMLYQSDNSVSAIHSALELVASHFSFERGYIFETSKDGKTTSNTFEWCAEGVTPEIDTLQQVPIEAVATANSHFYKTGTFVLKSLKDLDPVGQAVLAPQGIKSMFQFGIFDKSRLLGFIGFDNCRNEVVPSNEDIDEMATICNILATFFVKQHVDDASAKSMSALKEIMDTLDHYIYVINPKNFEVLYMNDKTKQVMNGHEIKDFCYRFFRGNAKPCEDCPVAILNRDHVSQATCEMYNKKLGIWIDATASVLRWTDGQDACLLNCTDITKRREERLFHLTELENLNSIDKLTGARTYHKFKKDAQAILEQQRDKSHMLVKLDIRNFKLVNQIYGYEKGNQILCCVAQALRATMRNDQEIFARVAADEFILLFNFYDESEIAHLYETFLREFHALMPEDFTYKCIFPHGRYIIHPKDLEKIDLIDMFEKVNTAHRAAKLDKMQEFVVYDENMTKDAFFQTEIENRMERALAGGEFLVYLQPKYHLDDESLSGAEALVRWKSDNADLFLPAAFISVFEKNGFITKLDYYMLHKVCQLLAGWKKQGLAPLLISVNFSRLHLNNKNFVRDLCEIVDQYMVERTWIEIEITETVMFDNMETLEKILDELHEAGFTMSMDDFGKGYSSLGMLKSLSVDVIKIDRSFFVDQKDLRRTKAVIGNVIKMAEALGIKIIAEGVEEKEQADLLRELSCDMVQGYYFAPPMPAEEFEKLVLNRADKETSS